MMRGQSPAEVPMLLTVYVLAFAGTRLTLGLPPEHWRVAIELLFYLVSIIAGGLFFSWVTRSLLRLRQHEHRQNNAMTRLVLESSQHAEDLAAIRVSLGIPRDDA